MMPKIFINPTFTYRRKSVRNELYDRLMDLGDKNTD
jgi:hypothetical protein